MTKFIYYTDPGHGWVKVPLKLLTELGLVQKITSYSYIRGDYAYLEEDYDAGLFMKAMTALGRRVVLDTRASRMRRSKIRSYDQYPAARSAAEFYSDYSGVTR